MTNGIKSQLLSTSYVCESGAISNRDILQVEKKIE